MTLVSQHLGPTSSSHRCADVARYGKEKVLFVQKAILRWRTFQKAFFKKTPTHHLTSFCHVSATFLRAGCGRLGLGAALVAGLPGARPAGPPRKMDSLAPATAAKLNGNNTNNRQIASNDDTSNHLRNRSRDRQTEDRQRVCFAVVLVR